MSDAHKPVINEPHDMPHEGPIKTPKQLVWAVVFAFLIPIFGIVLLVTGIVMWRQYFSHLFGIELIRIASLLHAFAAFVLICSILVHIYAGLWVKGSMGAMLYGWVSRGWARKHHAAWLKDVDKGKGH